MFTCKPYEVDSDLPIFPSSEDEPVVLEHFFVEPGCREDWVSGLLDLDALQIEKCFNIEDITGTFDYDLAKLDKDSVHPEFAEEEGKSPEVSFDTSQGISTRVNEENHFAKNASYGHCKIESGDKMIEISSNCVSVLKNSKTQQYSLLGQAEGNDTDEAFEDMSGLEALEIDKNWPEKHDLSCLESYELDRSLNLTKYEVFSDENEDKTMISSVEEFSGRSSGSINGTQKHQNMPRDQQSKRKRIDGFESLMVSTSDAVDEEDKTGKIVSPKRSRKPPRRYIEESLEYELKPFAKKCGIGKRSKDRLMQPKWQKEFLSEQVRFEDDSFNVGCIQVPFGLPLEKEHSKKSKPSPVRPLCDQVQSYEDPKESRVLDQCEKVDIEPLSVESQEDFSEDECVTTRSYAPKGNNSRRKRHISWTQEEVVKLVDGIAQCGVGRWTEIKRLLFSSSSHRTSVDLKDKWRNLLRASCSQLQIKEKVDNGRKQSANYVSDSILWRVRELAVLYPYPRDNRAKVSCTGPAVSSFSVPLSTVV